MHVWWFWWSLMNIDDACRLYSLWFYSVLGLLCFCESKSEILCRNESFLTSLYPSTSASGQCIAASPVLPILNNIAWPGQQYSLRMTNAVGWPPTMSFVAKRLKERAQAAMDLLVTAKWDKFMQSHVWNQNRNNWCGTFIIEYLFVISKLVV